jgi:hypothetical protein
MLSTENIGLKKPGYNDEADIAVINENSDIIDREFGNRYLKSETYSVEQVNNAIAQAIEALPNGLVYRGAVNYYNDLPTANNKLGDTYSVKYQGETGTTGDGNEYAWGEYDGTLQWIKLGVNAYTKDEIDAQREAIESDILKVKNNVGSYSFQILDNKRRWLVLNLGNSAQFNHIAISDLYGGVIEITGISPAYAESDVYKTVKVIRYSYGDWTIHDATRFTVYNGEPNYKIREVYYNPNNKKHYIEIRGYTSIRVTGASVSAPELVDYSSADVNTMTLIPESVYASKSALIALQERVTALETALSQTTE